MAQIIMIIAALAAPFLGYGWGRFKGQISEYHAVADERRKGAEACNARVLTIQTTHEADVRDAEERARAESAKIGETPVGAELKKLCDASPTCRSRRAR